MKEPMILSAGTYYWTPEPTADGRRQNEKRRLKEVADYFKSIGFEVITFDNSLRAELVRDHHYIVHFDYSESCHNVYKHISVWIDNNRSNIISIRKLTGAKG